MLKTMFDGLIMIAHVLSGAVAVAAGAAALLARKGARLHIRAGTLFALTMGVSSLLGALLGLMNPAEFYITVHAGVLGATLILSSWLAARARDGRLGRLTTGISLINLVNAASLLALGAVALGAPDRRFAGFPAEAYFFLFAMTALAAAGDVSLLFRKALSRTHRIARHLWRMCLSFFIAAGSAFTGPGAEAFPAALRESGLLALPEPAILLALVFWLTHTYWRGRSRA